MLENGDVVYNRLYSMLKGKKGHARQFLSVLNSLLEPSSDPNFTYFIAEMVSTLGFTYAYELQIVFSHLDSKIEGSAHRILSTLQVYRRKKEFMPRNVLAESLFIV